MPWWQRPFDAGRGGAAAEVAALLRGTSARGGISGASGLCTGRGLGAATIGHAVADCAARPRTRGLQGRGPADGRVPATGAWPTAWRPRPTSRRHAKATCLYSWAGNRRRSLVARGLGFSANSSPVPSPTRGRRASAGYWRRVMSMKTQSAAVAGEEMLALKITGHLGSGNQSESDQSQFERLWIPAELLIVRMLRRPRLPTRFPLPSARLPPASISLAVSPCPASRKGRGLDVPSRLPKDVTTLRSHRLYLLASRPVFHPRQAKRLVLSVRDAQTHATPSSRPRTAASIRPPTPCSSHCSFGPSRTKEPGVPHAGAEICA